MKSITGGLETKKNKSPTPLATTDENPLYVSVVRLGFPSCIIACLLVMPLMTVFNRNFPLFIQLIN